jgi:IS5 family transposase
MHRVVPWASLVDPIARYYPDSKSGRPPFAFETLPGQQMQADFT